MASNHGIHHNPPAGDGAALMWASAISLAWLLAFPRLVFAQDERESTAARSHATASEPVEDLAQLLARSDLTPDDIREIGPADPLIPSAQSTLWRVFRFLRRFQSELRTMAVDLPGPSQPAPVNLDWQDQMVSVVGQLRRITPCPLPPDLQDSFGTANYFRCEVRLEGSGAEALVYALQVPEPLLGVLGEPDAAGQPVSLLGLVTHVATKDPFPIAIVADNLLWQPSTPDESLGIDDRHVWLAAQGVDVVALRGVTDKSAMTTRDFASFYQLLSAARHWDNDQLKSRDPRLLQVSSLLQEPSLHRGSVMRVRGMARRIQLISTEPDVAARFGIPQYYEIALLTEVDPPIRIEAGDKSRLFSRYPVVVCATSLPDGMPTGDVLEPIEFTGVFLKAWAYPAAWLSGADDRFRQLSPLFIARQPKWLAAADEQGTSPAKVPLWLPLGVMLLLIALAWQVARWNRQLLRQRRQATAHSEPLNLDDLDLEP